jgi:predicted GNAT family acetyltransferase
MLGIPSRPAGRGVTDDRTEAMVMADSVDVVVKDAPERRRYEAWAGERLAGFAEYRREPGTLVLTHTEVDPEFEGMGVGARLAREVLDAARAEGLDVDPQCPFITVWIARHRDYLDLVPERWRSRITDRSR